MPVAANVEIVDLLIRSQPRTPLGLRISDDNEVLSVQPSSPADDAGVKQGDMIIAVDKVHCSGAGALSPATSMFRSQALASSAFERVPFMLRTSGKAAARNALKDGAVNGLAERRLRVRRPQKQADMISDIKRAIASSSEKAISADAHLAKSDFAERPAPPTATAMTAMPAAAVTKAMKPPVSLARTPGANEVNVVLRVPSGERLGAKLSQANCVKATVPNGWAQRGGLCEGDLIVAVNGELTTLAGSAAKALSAPPAEGATERLLMLTVRRGATGNECVEAAAAAFKPDRPLHAEWTKGSPGAAAARSQAKTEKEREKHAHQESVDGKCDTGGGEMRGESRRKDRSSNSSGDVRVGAKQAGGDAAGVGRGDRLVDKMTTSPTHLDGGDGFEEPELTVRQKCAQAARRQLRRAKKVVSTAADGVMEEGNLALGAGDVPLAIGLFSKAISMLHKEQRATLKGNDKSRKGRARAKDHAHGGAYSLPPLQGEAFLLMVTLLSSRSGAYLSAGHALEALVDAEAGVALAPSIAALHARRASACEALAKEKQEAKGTRGLVETLAEMRAQLGDDESESEKSGGGSGDGSGDESGGEGREGTWRRRRRRYPSLADEMDHDDGDFDNAGGKHDGDVDGGAEDRGVRYDGEGPDESEESEDGSEGEENRTRGGKEEYGDGINGRRAAENKTAGSREEEDDVDEEKVAHEATSWTASRCLTEATTSLSQAIRLDPHSEPLRRRYKQVLTASLLSDGQSHLVLRASQIAQERAQRRPEEDVYDMRASLRACRTKLNRDADKASDIGTLVSSAGGGGNGMGGGRDGDGGSGGGGDGRKEGVKKEGGGGGGERSLEPALTAAGTRGGDGDAFWSSLNDRLDACIMQWDAAVGSVASSASGHASQTGVMVAANCGSGEPAYDLTSSAEADAEKGVSSAELAVKLSRDAAAAHASFMRARHEEAARYLADRQAKQRVANQLSLEVLHRIDGGEHIPPSKRDIVAETVEANLGGLQFGGEKGSASAGGGGRSSGGRSGGGSAGGGKGAKKAGGKELVSFSSRRKKAAGSDEAPATVLTLLAKVSLEGGHEYARFGASFNADNAVTDVEESSPAKRSGLQPGDVLLSANDQSPVGVAAGHFLEKLLRAAARPAARLDDSSRNFVQLRLSVARHETRKAAPDTAKVKSIVWDDDDGSEVYGVETLQSF